MILCAETKTWSSQINIFLKILFIYLAAPGLSCSMQYLVPQSGMAQPGPLHGAHGVLATGPPGKFQGAFWKGADSVWTLP